MRLIDADALRVDYFAPSSTSSTPNFYFVSKASIDNAPTIDAVPVRHGEWKPFDLTYGRSIYYCSVCEQATEVPMCMEKPMYAYCPNCGAKMEDA